MSRNFGCMALIALLAILVAGCGGVREPVQRANRDLAPGSVVGPSSPDWDTPARLISGKSPAYPIGQFMTGKTGHAQVAFTVATDGTTQDIEVLAANQEVFGRHLAIAIQAWRFEPAMKEGRAVSSRLSVELDFDITRNFSVPRSPRERKRE